MMIDSNSLSSSDRCSCGPEAAGPARWISPDCATGGSSSNIISNNGANNNILGNDNSIILFNNSANGNKLGDGNIDFNITDGSTNCDIGDNNSVNLLTNFASNLTDSSPAAHTITINSGSASFNQSNLVLDATKYLSSPSSNSFHIGQEKSFTFDTNITIFSIKISHFR